MDMKEETVVRKEKERYALPLEDRLAYSVLEDLQVVGVSYTTLWRAIKKRRSAPDKGNGVDRGFLERS